MFPPKTPSFLALLCVLGLFAALPVQADPPPSSLEKNAPASDLFNGIHGRDYLDFEKKWKLITVRYRTDNGEQRFIYANDLAYNALQKGVKTYPDGAIFTKIAVKTLDDPDFVDSKVPSGSVRMQVMIHDQKKYAASAGWGYAIFAPDGSVMPSPQTQQEAAAACDACHRIVEKSRGGVFAQMANLRGKVPTPDAGAPSDKVSFRYADIGELPESLRPFLPEKIKATRFLEGPLRDKMFTGTFNEATPQLIAEAIHAGVPAVLEIKNLTSAGTAQADPVCPP